VLWTPAKTEEGLRYSIIYEFNQSKAIAIYEKYLTDVITPKSLLEQQYPWSYGCGEETYNQHLSLARANDVKNIIENSLSKAGRNDVKFELNGFGENENESPFENKTQKNDLTIERL
jgi:hypothetical protein